MFTGIDGMSMQNIRSRDAPPPLLKEPVKASKSFNHHDIKQVSSEKSIFNIQDRPAEADLTRLNRSQLNTFKDGALPLAKSVCTRFNLTTPIFDLVNYLKQPSDKTERAMQSTIETQINKLGGGKQEELKALNGIDFAAYISDINAYALGTEQPYSDEYGQLFTKMLEDICRGLKDGRNMDSLKKHARTILNKLSTTPSPILPGEIPDKLISGNYPPTPETIMFKYQVLLHNNELDIDQGVDHFVHECHMMHDFYLSMEPSGLDARSMLLEQSVADLANLESGKTLTGTISNALKKVTDLVDKNGPVLYLTILATALIARGVATPSKMAELAVILAPFLLPNSSTSTTASAKASPPNLKNLLNDDKALGKIENLFTVNTAGSVEMKPENLGASWLYFIGTAQNAAERAKSANLEGPSEELLQTLFSELKSKFMEEEVKQNSAALDNPDEFVNLITTTTDKIVNKVGVGASYLRAGLNVCFEFKLALPNLPFLDYLYSELNRLFVPTFEFETEVMKHDGIVPVTPVNIRHNP